MQVFQIFLTDVLGEQDRRHFPRSYSSAVSLLQIPPSVLSFVMLGLELCKLHFSFPSGFLRCSSTVYTALDDQKAGGDQRCVHSLYMKTSLSNCRFQVAASKIQSHGTPLRGTSSSQTAFLPLSPSFFTGPTSK